MTQALGPAAAYVRMSTEDQRYSIDNQQAAIAEYASRNGFAIVANFSDAGISGLDLKHRPGLKNLLNVVVAGSAPFSTILVLDVSRWGRFQDIDESAYYEFLCRQAGVRVQYCAEAFINDLSPFSNLVKTIKRTMAAEYSRELGAKVFRGQCRLAEMGFKQGGSAPMGFRRLLLDEHGNAKQILKRGERKSLVSDRVILVPGPASEVRFVRNLFKTTLSGRSLNSITKELRQKKCYNRRWTLSGLTRMLSHPIYTGAYVYNRTTCKLKSGCKRNPSDQWVCAPRAVAPIIPIELFEAVQRRLAHLTIRCSNQELLRRLQILWEKVGYLDFRLVDQSPITPSASVYCQRFGNMASALRLVGYPVDHRYELTRRNVLAHLRKDSWERLKQNVRDSGLHLRIASRSKYRIHVGGAPSFNVVYARPIPGAHPKLGPLWEIRNHRPWVIGRSIVVVMSHDDQPLEYVITSYLRKTPVKCYRFGLDRLTRISLARFKEPSQFCETLRLLGYVCDARKVRGTSSLGRMEDDD